MKYNVEKEPDYSAEWVEYTISCEGKSTVREFLEQISDVLNDLEDGDYCDTFGDFTASEDVYDKIKNIIETDELDVDIDFDDNVLNFSCDSNQISSLLDELDIDTELNNPYIMIRSSDFSEYEDENEDDDEDDEDDDDMEYDDNVDDIQ